MADEHGRHRNPDEVDDDDANAPDDTPDADDDAPAISDEEALAFLKPTAPQRDKRVIAALVVGVLVVGALGALVAWLGGVGRFISVGVVVLSVATAITHAIPEFLSGVVPFLPLTPAMEGARAIASGGPGAGGAAGLLLAWLLMGVAAGVLAVARHRVAKVPELAPAPA